MKLMTSLRQFNQNKNAATHFGCDEDRQTLNMMRMNEFEKLHTESHSVRLAPNTKAASNKKELDEECYK